MNELVMQQVEGAFEKTRQRFPNTNSNNNVIKIIGIGGAGNNILKSIMSQIQGVTCIAAETDYMTLAMKSSLPQAHLNIKLGVKTTNGLGAGSNPEKGRKAAEESLQEIIEALKGADIVLLVAGMGGGTGTGATQIIADATRTRGIFTIGLVTLPLLWEGNARMTIAKNGINELDKRLNSLIVVPNEQPGNSLLDTFKAADEIFIEAIRGFTDLLINKNNDDGSFLLEEAYEPPIEPINHDDCKDIFSLANDRTELLIAQHIRTLALKYNQTIYQDDYGNYFFDKWDQAQDYFIDNVLRKDDLISNYLLASKTGAYNYPHFARTIIRNAIKEYINIKSESNVHLSVNVDNLSPIDFEHYCADILRHNGWDARVTQAAGDQGIDVIATRRNIKAVLQCKKYSQPVGNGSVQEIIAGKQYERADIACVVSNNTYTPSAKQLANAAGVHLLHYSELEQFAEKVGIA
jgi:hypothetical protein